MGILSNEQREPNQEKPANRGGGTLSQTLTWSRSSLRCIRQELAQSGHARTIAVMSAVEGKADVDRLLR
jgi:hypothetical protein